jgi:hypothetical protein
VGVGKKKAESMIGINDAFLRILKDNTAGEAMDPESIWGAILDLSQQNWTWNESYWRQEINKILAN